MRYGPTMRECAENRGCWERFEREQEDRWLHEAGEDLEPVESVPDDEEPVR